MNGVKVLPKAAYSTTMYTSNTEVFTLQILEPNFHIKKSADILISN
jgi:hypothetical protein